MTWMDNLVNLFYHFENEKVFQHQLQKKQV